MNCWGWGTWRDRWKYFEKKPDKLIKYFDKNLDKKRFNLNNNLNYFGQILRNKNNKINTWAVFWYAQIFKNNGLCLSPNYSLVRNNGFDKFSSHSHPKHYMNIIYKRAYQQKKFHFQTKFLNIKIFIMILTIFLIKKLILK